MKNKLTQYIVLASIGLAIITGLILTLKTKNENLTSSPTQQSEDTEITESETKSIVVERDSDTAAEPVNTEIQIKAPIEVKRNLVGQNTMTGILLTFPVELDTDRTKRTAKDLPDFKLNPKTKFEAKWISSKMLQIQFQEDLKPNQEFELDFFEYPINSTQKVVLSKKSGRPWTIKTPDPQLESISLLKYVPRKSAQITAQFNYPVKSSQLRKAIKIKYKDELGKVTEIRNFSIQRGEDSSTQVISFRSALLNAGEIQIETVNELNIAGVNSSLKPIDPIPLIPPQEFNVGRVKVVQGSDSYMIEVSCGFNGRYHNDYYSRKKKCEVDPELAKKFIQVEPAIPYNVLSGRGNLKLIGAFVPNTSYSIKFIPGLTVNNEYILGEEVEKSVIPPDYKPSFNFKNKARYLPSNSPLNIQYEAVNVSKIKVQIYQIYPQNMVFWLTNSNEFPSNNVGDLIKDFEVELTGKTNQKQKGHISLKTFNPKGHGVFAIHVKDAKGYSNLDFSTVVVTDIGAVVKKDKEDLFIWTKSLQNLSSKSTVKIQAMSYSNKEIGSCVTGGADGGCVLKGLMKSSEKPFALLLKTRNDLTYVRFSDLQIDDDRVHAGTLGYSSKNTHLEGYIYASRGVFRPGETVHLAAILHDMNKKAANDSPIQWKIKSPKGKVVKELATQTTKNGMTAIDFETYESNPTGKYEATLYSGKKAINTYAFLVEEFVPERIKVKVNSKQDEFINQDTGQFEVDSKFLFGPPVANGDYKGYCSIAPAFYTIPGNPKFSTGVYTKNPPSAVQLDVITGKLNNNGIAKFKCDYASKLGVQYPTVMQLTASAAVSEAGSGRVTLGKKKVLLSNHSTILGLKVESASQKKIHVQGQLFDLNGKPVNEDTRLEISLNRIQREWFYTYRSWGGSEWTSEEFLIPDGNSQTIDVKQGKFETTLNTSRSWGDFVIRAKSKVSPIIADVKTSMGWGYYSNGRYSGNFSTPKAAMPGDVEIRTSKTTVKKGENFNVEFESPFEGEALVSIETDKVIKSEWKDVKRGKISFKLRAPDVEPNFYVSVLILKNPNEKNSDRYLPARVWGAQSLKIDPEDKKITPVINAPKLMRGNNELVIEIGNKEQLNSEYTVSVVDEGILQLTRFKTPNPLDQFFAPRRLGVKSFETLGWTYSYNSGDSDTPGGGGGPSGQGQASKVMPVKLVNYWSGIVKSDSKGRAQVRFKVPPFQGKVRVMVVAAGRGKEGSSEKFVTVRDPIVIQPTVPRFLSFQDQFKIPVNISNLTGKESEITVKVKTSKELEVKKPLQKIKLGNDASKVVYFDAKVKEYIGRAKLDFSAEGNGEKSVDDFNIEIIPSAPEHSVVIAKKADQEIDLNGVMPADFRRDSVNIQISASTLPHLSEMGHLKSLIRYPYGCIEQTTSSTYPLLFVKNIIKWADPSFKSDADFDDMIQAGIERILSMQTPSGGFGYWPGAYQPVLWGTAYALNMLLDAKAKGYIVPKSSINDALTYLSSNVKNYRHSSHSRSHIRYSEPFVLYTLAKGKQPVKDHVVKLLNETPDWGVMETENLFLLMAASHLAGEHNLVKKIKKTAGLFTKEVKSNERFHRNTFWSSFRTDGLRLSISEDLYPDYEGNELLAQRIARKLAQSRTHYSTQELVWGIVGLGKRMNAYKGVSVKNASVTLNSKPLKKTSTDEKMPTWSILRLPKGPAKINGKFDSEKSPFFYIRYDGFLNSMVPPKSTNPGFSIKRSYFKLSGEPMLLENVKQGQLVVVKLSLTNFGKKKLENLAIVDRIPAGFEIENQRLGRGMDLEWTRGNQFNPDYLDIRDDRIQFFGDIKGDYNGYHRKEYYYIVRAVTSGSFVAPPAKMELMYDPNRYVYTQPKRIKIVNTGAVLAQ